MQSICEILWSLWVLQPIETCDLAKVGRLPARSYAPMPRFVPTGSGPPARYRPPNSAHLRDQENYVVALEFLSGPLSRLHEL